MHNLARSGDAVSEWVRTYDWRPGGPGLESHCGDFVSELWQFRLKPVCQPLAPSIWLSHMSVVTKLFRDHRHVR